MRRYNPDMAPVCMIGPVVAAMAAQAVAIQLIDWKLYLAGGLMDKHDRRTNFFSYWINRLDFL